MLFPGFFQLISNNTNGPNNQKIIYDVYPDTDQAPVLDFIWGTPNLETDEIARVTPYGVLEGGGDTWSPSTEILILPKRSHS